jgi:hypothetical protein
LSLPAIEPGLLNYPGHYLVAIPTELSWLHAQRCREKMKEEERKKGKKEKYNVLE